MRLDYWFLIDKIYLKYHSILFASDYKIKIVQMIRLNRFFILDVCLHLKDIEYDMHRFEFFTKSIKFLRERQIC